MKLTHFDWQIGSIQYPCGLVAWSSEKEREKYRAQMTAYGYLRDNILTPSIQGWLDKPVLSPDELTKNPREVTCLLCLTSTYCREAT